MEQHTTMPGAVTGGLDVSDRSTYVCILNAAGEVVDEGRVTTTPEAVRRRSGSLAPMRIILEAGTHSPRISRLLAECGHDVLVANARRLPLIAQNDSKNDRVDAETPARMWHDRPTSALRRSERPHPSPSITHLVAQARSRDNWLRGREA